VAADWRRGFGRYGEDEADVDVFEETMAAVRRDHAEEFVWNW
jgi:hypothetical protein